VPFAPLSSQYLFTISEGINNHVVNVDQHGANGAWSVTKRQVA